MSGSVAELVKDMQGEAARGMAEVLSRYAALVGKAAGGKLTHDEAVMAASLAYEMGLPADRFDRDVAIMRAERVLAEQVERDAAEKEASRAKGDEYRALLRELELEHRKTQAAIHGIAAQAMERTQRKVEHARILKTNPHLFNPTAGLTDAQWREVRT